MTCFKLVNGRADPFSRNMVLQLYVKCFLKTF